MTTEDNRPNTALIVSAVVAFVVTVVCITAVAIAIEDGARAASMIGLIVGPLTSILGILVLLGRVNGVDQAVKAVRKDTGDLKNGVMQAKVRDALVEVLAPHLIDDAARPQLERDAATRAARENGEHA